MIDAKIDYPFFGGVALAIFLLVMLFLAFPSLGFKAQILELTPKMQESARDFGVIGFLVVMAILVVALGWYLDPLREEKNE